MSAICPHPHSCIPQWCAGNVQKNSATCISKCLKKLSANMYKNILTDKCFEKEINQLPFSVKLFSWGVLLKNHASEKRSELVCLVQSILTFRIIRTRRTTLRKTVCSESTLSSYPNCLSYKNHHADFNTLSISTSSLRTSV